MTTPYMNLDLPVVSLTIGPAWATQLNAALAQVDVHNHASGSGVPVPSTGLNINAALPFNGNDATALRTVRFSDQTSPLTAPADAGCLYLASGNLFFNSGAGTAVQITAGSGLAGTPGSIGGLVSPAAVTYTPVSSTFRFTSNANVNASIDVGPILIRQPIASANSITLQSPNSLAASYALTLPTALPAGQRISTIDNLGTMSFWNIDGTTIVNNAGTLGAIGTTAIAVNSSTTLKGNRNAADGGADVVVDSSVLRTAGYLFKIGNNGAQRVLVDFAGNVNTISQVQAASFAPALTLNPVNLIGSQLAASTGADVVSNGTNTRTAGYIHEFQNNGVAKARVGFDGVIHSPNTSATVRLTTDTVTSGTTFVTTGLSIPTPTASSAYRFHGHFRIHGPNGIGFKIQIVWPTPGTGAIFAYTFLGGTTVTTGLGASSTPTRYAAVGGDLVGFGNGTLWTFDANGAADFFVEGFLLNGATGGSWVFQFASGTAGFSVAIEARSYVSYARMDGGFD